MSAEAALGLIQTPYAGLDGVLRQDYKASLRGGSGNASYNVGATYSHTNDWLPNGETSRQSNPSVYGGMRYTRGILTIDASGRYDAYDVPQVFNPVFFETGFLPFSKPNHQLVQTQNQTVGLRISAGPTPWWQNTVTVGIDRWTSETEQSRPRLTTPADTLLTVQSIVQSKRSFGYNTSVQGALGSRMSGSLTVGIDHWALPLTTWFTSGALNTRGSISTAPGQLFFASRTNTNNTGYFAQGQVGFADALFLTAGVRAEDNTDFGDSLGTPLSPRFGLSYVQPVGGASLKVRGSWGRAIRAPASGLKLAAASPVLATLANPDLGPERQQGWDAGLDAVFGRRGQLGVTFYNQTADNLIQTVVFQTTPLTQQNQNVGRVKNTGLEVEGAIFLGALRLKAQYGYARSRVEQLSPTYTGDLRVGDQSQFTPKHTLGASASLILFKGTTVAAGLVYVGSWTGADQVALNRCRGGTGPCRPTTRDYVVPYPSFVKANASVTQAITSVLSGFMSVDNLTNNDAYEFNNFRPMMGRIATVGLGLHY